MVRRVGLGVAALALLAAGCENKGGVSGSDDSDAWRTSRDPVTTSGLAWATGSTVHLSDGTTIDTGGPVSAFVVAGDGVFFFPPQSEEEEGSADYPVQELRFGAPGEPPTDTGLTLSSALLAASPDGRHLAAVDVSSGEKDDFGTPQASVVVFDLETGEQTIDSTLGMGDPDEDDFADGYAEAELKFWAVTNEHVFVNAMGDYAFDLATGEGRELGEDERSFVSDDLVSPDGKWRIEKPDNGPDRMVATDGQEVELDPSRPRWFVSWWADAQTVVGGVISGPGRGKRVEAGDTAALMTCLVPTGECQVFDETSGHTVVFPIDEFRPEAFVLPEGGSS